MTDSPSPTKEHAPTRLAPDMTLPGLFLGVIVGVGLLTVYPEQARMVLTLSIAGGWLLGFMLTIFPPGRY